MPYLADEVHHSGWNACSSCFDKPSSVRNRLILPGLLSSRIYAIDVASDPKAPRIDKVNTCVHNFVELDPKHFFVLSKIL